MKKRRDGGGVETGNQLLGRCFSLRLCLQLDSTLKVTREIEIETKTEDLGQNVTNMDKSRDTVPNLEVMSEVKRTCESCKT